MINSLYLSPNCLFTLNSAATLSVYRLEQTLAQSSNSLPKLQSSLGIYWLNFRNLFEEADRCVCPANRQSGQIHITPDLSYDRQNIIALNGSQLSTNPPQLNVVFNLSVTSLSHSIQDIQDKSLQVSTVSICGQNQHEQTQILITTNSGSIHLMKLTSQMALEEVKSTSVELLDKKNSSQIVTESEQDSLGFFSSANQVKQNSEYICAVESGSKVWYMATSKQRLLAIKRDSLEMGGVFETSEVDAIKGGEKQVTVKVVLARNSVLVLFPRKLVQFNIYTFTQSAIIALPVHTLDFTLLECAKTLSCSLMMVGECNKVYSVNYESTMRKSGQVLSDSAEISSRMGKCVQVRDRLVLVGGSDGTVDVLLNGEMLLMVLVEGMQNQ